MFDRAKYPGGTEYKMLVKPGTIIRAAAVIGILGLIYCLLR